MKKILIIIGIILSAIIIIYSSYVIISINRLKNPVLYSVVGMDRVNIEKDIIFKSTDGTDLKMDLYHPDMTGKYPVVILLHGIGPGFLTKNAKDWGIFTSYGKILAASGFAVITFNRRESADFELIEKSAEDIDDLLKFIRNNAEKYCLDAYKTSVWAFSAGAVYLSLAISHPKQFRCLVSYYGLLDLRLYRKKISKKITDEVIEQYSPITWLKKRPETPPMLIVKAGKERIRAISESNDNFLKEAKKYNMRIHMTAHETGHHGFDATDDNDRTKEIIKETIDFLKTYLKY